MTHRHERRDRRHLRRRHMTVCRRQHKRRDRQEFNRTARIYLGV